MRHEMEGKKGSEGRRQEREKFPYRLKQLLDKLGRNHIGQAPEKIPKIILW